MYNLLYPLPTTTRILTIEEINVPNDTEQKNRRRSYIIVGRIFIALDYVEGTLTSTGTKIAYHQCVEVPRRTGNISLYEP